LVTPDASARRVLIYRLGSLGDTIVALPCFHLIARAFPDAERCLLTNIPIHAKAPAAAAVLGDSGLVQNYMRYSIGSRNPVELLRLAGRIRRFAPDLLVYLAVSHGAGTAHRDVHRDVLFFRLCGIRRLVGLPEGNLAENRFDPATGLWETEAARLLRCIRPLGDVDLTDPSNWDLRLTDAETAKAAELLAPFGSRPIISCGPGTKMQSKDWGQEKWRELLRRMSVRFPDHALTMIGAREDSPVAEYASASWNGPVLNFCGALTPRESAAVIRRARLFLGPDSGPMHLAAAYGVPCAIPFAALDLRGRWFPTGQGHQPIYHPVACSNCGLETCIEKKKICIDSISVEEMFQAAMQAIGRSERMP
jgi:ADP-heptose:LPS heptosyltransferase